MKKIKRINLSVHLKDLIVVTLGILIAFGLNSWNENRKQENLANSYLSSLKEELKSNKIELKSKLDYHSKLLATLRNDPSNAKLILNPATLSDVGWKSGGSIIRDYIDPELFRKIILTYQTHEDLVNHTRSASEKINEISVMSPFLLVNVGNTLSKTEKAKLKVKINQGWIPIFESWTAIETIYIENIDDALDYWEQHRNE